MLAIAKHLEYTSVHEYFENIIFNNTGVPRYFNGVKVNIPNEMIATALQHAQGTIVEESSQMFADRPQLLLMENEHWFYPIKKNYCDAISNIKILNFDGMFRSSVFVGTVGMTEYTKVAIQKEPIILSFGEKAYILIEKLPEEKDSKTPPILTANITRFTFACNHLALYSEFYEFLYKNMNIGYIFDHPNFTEYILFENIDQQKFSSKKFCITSWTKKCIVPINSGLFITDFKSNKPYKILCGNIEYKSNIIFAGKHEIIVLEQEGFAKDEKGVKDEKDEKGVKGVKDETDIPLSFQCTAKYCIDSNYAAKLYNSKIIVQTLDKSKREAYCFHRGTLKILF